MKRATLLISLTTGLLGNIAHANHLRGWLSVDGATNPILTPGEPIDLDIGIVDQNGQAVTDFELVDQKFMHLVLISEDLEQFSHIHPYLNQETGQFSIALNTANDDPDNVDAADALLTSGKYFVFVETKPAGALPETVSMDLTVQGDAPQSTLTPDPQLPNRTIVKYLDSDGQISQEGAPYKVEFMVHGSGGNLMLMTSIFEKVDAQYLAMTTLQPWLGMCGHALIVSAKGNTAAEKDFHHMHAMNGDHGGEHGGGHGSEHATSDQCQNVLNFSPESGNPVSAGWYKIWVQFSHQNRVWTVPFVTEL
jgi:hypothetical protein